MRLAFRVDSAVDPVASEHGSEPGSTAHSPHHRYRNPPPPNTDLLTINGYGSTNSPPLNMPLITGKVSRRTNSVSDFGSPWPTVVNNQ